MLAMEESKKIPLLKKRIGFLDKREKYEEKISKYIKPMNVLVSR